MKRCSGTQQFDPAVLNEFLSLLQEHEVHAKELDSRPIQAADRPVF